MWLQAGFWGLVAGSALLIGAVIGYMIALPKRLIAAVMAFGSGVLISALSFDLMDEAYRRGGFDSTALGFVGGAAVYTAANWFLSRQGAKHRKRSGDQQASESEDSGSGTAIALGALLDGIPESMVIGLSLLQGGAVSTVAVVAIFLSNIPEGLSSSAGMKHAGRSKMYVFGLWAGIAVISGVAALAGYVAWVWARPRVVGRGPWTVTLPGGPLTLLQIGIGIIDLGFCALAMYVLVPDEPNLGFVTVAVIFVSATLLGFASHSPGGLGVFDAAMLVGLWQMDREDLLAGMLLFRMLYYIAPFVTSVILLTLREVIIGARSKRLQRLAAMAEAQTRVEPRREAVYVRERKEGGA